MKKAKDDLAKAIMVRAIATAHQTHEINLAVFIKRRNVMLLCYLFSPKTIDFCSQVIDLRANEMLDRAYTLGLCIAPQCIAMYP